MAEPRRKRSLGEIMGRTRVIVRTGKLAICCLNIVPRGKIRRRNHRDKAGGREKANKISVIQRNELQNLLPHGMNGDEHQIPFADFESKVRSL